MTMNKEKIIVAGASGFIGGHLVRRLKAEGYEVIGMDILPPLYESADQPVLIDLRREQDCEYAFKEIGPVKEVYNLACLMGGMGFIGDPAHDYDIMVGSSRIVSNILECGIMQPPERSFFSSSACVYNEHKQKKPGVSLKETDAYPAMPDLVYGWQKLFSEQMYSAATSKGLSVRIARFHNIFGPEGTYDGGKEKAPAALCRKVVKAGAGDNIAVWGAGDQTRSFLYIDECIEGIRRLMGFPYDIGPVNIGSSQRVTINELAQMIIDISGKDLCINNIPGPEGVRGRNSNNNLIRNKLLWAPSAGLRKGLEKTYAWIEQTINQVNA